MDRQMDGSMNIWVMKWMNRGIGLCIRALGVH